MNKCPLCGEADLCSKTITYNCDCLHDGVLYAVSIPMLHVLMCPSCCEMFFDNKTDEQISKALRDQLGLLSPAEVYARAELVPGDLLKRIQSGRIQSRDEDNELRDIFDRYQNQNRFVKIIRWLRWKPYYAMLAPLYGWSLCMGLADCKMNHVYSMEELYTEQVFDAIDDAQGGKVFND